VRLDTAAIGIVMLTRKIAYFIVTSVVWLGTPTSLMSAELDFNTVLICKFEYLKACEEVDPDCEHIEVVHIDGEQAMHLNPKKMQFATFIGKEKTGGSKIDSIKHVEHQVYLHGNNPDSPIAVNGTGWVAKIGKKSGKFSAAVLADVTAYFIYGTCHNQ